MSGWTKLFSSIVTSSVWVADDATLRVWIAMLATADADGIVEGSVPGFASMARVTTDQMRMAVQMLTSADPDSRTPDHEGRRIEAIEGGWRILNYRAYRDRGQAKEGSKAPAMRAYRARLRSSTVTAGNALTAAVTGEPEERGEKRDKERATSPAAPSVLSPDVLRLAWNELTTAPLPRCLELNIGRRQAAEARLRDRGLEGMRQIFTLINGTPFCRGENDRGWCANFDWALKPASIVKVLEGQYATNRRANQPQDRPSVTTGPAVQDAASTRRYLQELEA